MVPDEVLSEAVREAGSESAALNLLLQKKFINAQDFARVRSEVYKLPLLELETEFTIPQELLTIFSQESIVKLKILPIRREGEEITIGIVEPENIRVDAALDFIGVAYNVSLKRFVISSEDFENALKRFSSLGIEVSEAIRKLGQESEGEEVAGKPITSQVALQRLAEAAPVTRIVDAILEHGVEGAASDIHIEPTGDQLRIRYRVDGRLKASLILPKEILPAVVSRVKVLARLRVDETRIPQDGRIHLRFGSKAIDFRVSTFPTIEGEKVALRILDPAKGILSLEELGLRFKNLENVKSFMNLPFGAMLISGPTGSGKTTTLYSVLNQLNKEEENIVTLEDPVEYYISGINQSQVYPEIKYDFASGLREIVRQDPNIIMVGEVRDNETASLLIHAALTGHLVFSTIHTNDVIGIIPRLLDMGIENFFIPTSLKLIIAQRLIPRLCQNCKERYVPPSRIQEIVESELRLLPHEVLTQLSLKRGEANPLTLFKSKGCEDCTNRGVKGRIALFESIPMSEELEKVIIELPTESNLKKEVMRQGMTTMRQDGIIKALEGMVSIEGVFANTEASQQ